MLKLEKTILNFQTIDNATEPHIPPIIIGRNPLPGEGREGRFDLTWRYTWNFQGQQAP